MRITVESTDITVALMIDGIAVPARIWRGVTSEGVPCMAYITRIAPMENTDEAAAAFERELLYCGTHPGPDPGTVNAARIVEEP
jgi:hypothetical protein